jgi:hypothetical protein
MMGLDRQRTATHEAGHLAMAAALRVPVGMASIRPSETAGYYGICTHGRTSRTRSIELVDVDRPWPMVRADVRRSIEKEILILLAGEMAVRLFAPMREPGFIQEPRCIVRASELAGSALTKMEKIELVGLETGATPIDSKPESERAHGYSVAAVGQELAHKFLSFHEAQAEQILTNSSPRYFFYALRDELLEHDVASRSRVRAILAENWTL